MSKSVRNGASAVRRDVVDKVGHSAVRVFVRLTDDCNEPARPHPRTANRIRRQDVTLVAIARELRPVPSRRLVYLNAVFVSRRQCLRHFSTRVGGAMNQVTRILSAIE